MSSRLASSNGLIEECEVGANMRLHQLLPKQFLGLLNCAQVQGLAPATKMGKPGACL